MAPTLKTCLLGLTEKEAAAFHGLQNRPWRVHIRDGVALPNSRPIASGEPLLEVAKGLILDVTYGV